MKYGKIIIGAACGLTAILAFAGGNPQYVQFPGDYQGSFTNYAMMNRAGSAAVAKMYANDIAIASARKGQPAASGSVIVMEVYKPKKGSDGKPIVGSDGVNKIDKLAAIAVMERRTTWPGNYAASDRVGRWGFAIYNPDGTPKANKLDCVTCHSPLEQQDYMFSHQWLTKFVGG